MYLSLNNHVQFALHTNVMINIKCTIIQKISKTRHVEIKHENINLCTSKIESKCLKMFKNYLIWSQVKNLFPYGQSYQCQHLIAVEKDEEMGSNITQGTPNYFEIDKQILSIHIYLFTSM